MCLSFEFVTCLKTGVKGQAEKVQHSMWGEMLSKMAFQMFWPLVSGQVLTTLLQHLTSPLIPPPLWSVMKSSLKTMGKEMMWILLPVAPVLMMRPEPTPTLTLAHLYLPGCSLFLNKHFLDFFILLLSLSDHTRISSGYKDSPQKENIISSFSALQVTVYTW